MNAAAEHCEPIVLLGASRRQRLAQSIEQSLAEWRRQWSAGIHGALEVHIADSLCSKPPVGGGRAPAFAAGSPGRELLVISAPMELQHELLGLPAPRIGTDGESASEVLAEALRDLCLRLARTKSLDPVNVTTLQADELAQAWRRYGLSVTVKSGTDRVLMRARLFPELVLAMLPVVAVKPPEPLASRRSAIGTEPMSVQAWLGEAEVTLAELANLQPGNVILLDVDLGGAGHLSLPDGRQLAQIRLGSASGRRAVSVIGKAAGR